MNIIRELYHGNIAPSECCYKSDSEFSKLGLQWLELHNEFAKGLTEQQREQFIQLTDIQGQQTSVVTEESYVQGFRDGARMVLDMLSYNEN